MDECSTVCIIIQQPTDGTHPAVKHYGVATVWPGNIDVGACYLVLTGAQQYASRVMRVA